MDKIWMIGCQVTCLHRSKKLDFEKYSPNFNSTSLSIQQLRHFWINVKFITSTNQILMNVH